MIFFDKSKIFTLPNPLQTISVRSYNFISVLRIEIKSNSLTCVWSIFNSYCKHAISIIIYLKSYSQVGVVGRVIVRGVAIRKLVLYYTIYYSFSFALINITFFKILSFTNPILFYANFLLTTFSFTTSTVSNMVLLVLIWPWRIKKVTWCKIR